MFFLSKRIGFIAVFLMNFFLPFIKIFHFLFIVYLFLLFAHNFFFFFPNCFFYFFFLMLLQLKSEGNLKFINSIYNLSTLVHGLTVGPTPNPDDLFSSILFNKYDLPVLYIPATATTPKGPGRALMNSRASSQIVYSIIKILSSTLKTEPKKNLMSEKN